MVVTIAFKKAVCSYGYLLHAFSALSCFTYPNSWYELVLKSVRAFDILHQRLSGRISVQLSIPVRVFSASCMQHADSVLLSMEIVYL
jgi:hypothetical protein